MTDKKYRFLINSSLGLYNRLDDKEFLKKKFKFHMGYDLDLKSPVTYNEKLQWLKIYDKNDIYTTFVDKYSVKEYIASKIGNQYIIPTLGVWNSFDEIDFESLPNQFVLKCTHDSGGLVICKNKNTFNYKSAREKINKALKRNYYFQHREWPYKCVKPRIIAEKYMEDFSTGELRDYKFFAFNGKVEAMFIASERQKQNEEVKFDFFDPSFKHLPIKQGHPNAEKTPEKPKNFDEMIKIAEELSLGIPHVRVDFYEVNEKIYFGEMTLFHFAGLVPFEPNEWDNIFGNWIKLPSITD